MEQAPARDVERIAVFGGLDPEGDVRFEFALEPIVQVPRGQVLPLACEGRVIDPEEHAEGRLADLDPGQRHRQLGGCDRVADLDGGQADDRHDVSGLGLLDLDAAQLVEQQHAVDRSGNGHPARLEKRGLLASPDLSGDDPADGDPAHILGEVERGAEHGEGPVLLDHRTGNLLDDQVEEWPDVAGGAAGSCEAKPALPEAKM